MISKKRFMTLVMTLIIIGLIPASVSLGRTVVENIELTTDKDFVFIDSYVDKLKYEEDYVLTEYEEYKEIFSSDKIKKKDFEKNNYIVVEIADHCDMREITPAKYTINNYDIDVLVRYKLSCGACAPTYHYYLLRLDKMLTEAEIRLNYEAVTTQICDDVEY